MNNEVMVQSLLGKAEELQKKAFALNEAARILQNMENLLNEEPKSSRSIRLRRKSKGLTIGVATVRVLKNSDTPPTTADITEAINAKYGLDVSTNSVSTSLIRLKERGWVKEVPEISPIRWVLGERMDNRE